MVDQKFRHSLKILNLFGNKELNDINLKPNERIRANILIQNDPNKHKLFEEPFVRKIFKVASYAIVCR